MAWTLESNWKPTRLLEIAGSVDTSTGATEVTTDAGRAYIKPMGNRQGPHVLATDWVGTHLAKWFGLSTFDIAVLTLQDDDIYDLPRGAMAQPGPAFASKAMAGDPWEHRDWRWIWQLQTQSLRPFQRNGMCRERLVLRGAS